MTTQHKPATPLPWTAVSDYYPETGRDEQFSPYIVGGAEKTNVAAAMMQPRERDFLANRAYLAHAANAYPRLIKRMLELSPNDPLLTELGEKNERQEGN